MASPTKDCRNVTVTDNDSIRLASPTKDCRNVTATDMDIIGLVLITCLTLVTMFIAIFGVVYDPKEPEFRVELATFSPVNATGSELTAAWDLTLRVENPNNKYSIVYEQLEVLVQDGGDFIISTVQLSPFSQPAKNTTTIRARLSVVGEYVGGQLVPEISKDLARGSLSFGVQVVARTRFSPPPLIGWKTNLLWLRCNAVEFVLLGNHSTSKSGGASKLCK